MIISKLEEFKEEINKFKNNWKKIVWTNGCFDIIHPWHLANFKKAKEYWDILVVWVNWDKSPYRKEKPGRPINDEIFRTKMIDALKYIDIVYIYNEETPIKPITIILPNILIKWWDYEIEKIVWYKEVVENGWEVITIPFVEWYSTTNIVNRILEVYKK